MTPDIPQPQQPPPPPGHQPLSHSSLTDCVVEVRGVDASVGGHPAHLDPLAALVDVLHRLADEEAALLVTYRKKLVPAGGWWDC